MRNLPFSDTQPPFPFSTSSLLFFTTFYIYIHFGRFFLLEQQRRKLTHLPDIFCFLQKGIRFGQETIRWKYVFVSFLFLPISASSSSSIIKTLSLSHSLFSLFSPPIPSLLSFSSVFPPKRNK